MQEKKEAVSGTTDRELMMTRLYNAPVKLIWEVWTNPEHIKHWWGPNGFTNTIFSMDVKPNGLWDFIMHGPDGTDYENKNVFAEIIKHKKIVYDHITAPKHRTTITFTEEGNKTSITMHMIFETAELKDQVVKKYKADEGLKQNMNRLSEYLAKMS